jgi:hypothetical protein
LYEGLNKASHKMGLAFSFAHFSAYLHKFWAIECVSFMDLPKYTA